MSADVEPDADLAAEHRNAVRTVWSTLAAWAFVGALLIVLVLCVPTSVGLAIAALLIVGPLFWAAFRRT